VIEEIVVQLDESTEMLHFIIHWKGGCHTEFQMEKPRSAVGKATDVEDIDLIRKMADRYEDGEIARVLNKMNGAQERACPGVNRASPTCGGNTESQVDVLAMNAD